MTYRNTITGAIINIESEIHGGTWEAVEALKPAETSAAPAQTEKLKRNKKK